MTTCDTDMKMSNVRCGGLAHAIVLLALAGCAARPAVPPAAPPAPAATGPVTFAPGTARYRRASHLYIEQEVGGQTQRLTQTLVYYVSAKLSRAGDHLSASLTVDSVPLYQSDGPGAELAERARGAVFTGRLAPDGEITALRGADADSTNKLVQQLAEDLRSFYPRIPPAGVAPEASWSDTTETTSRTGGLPLTMVALSQHRAGVPADAGPRRALPIRTFTTYAFSGTGSQGGQAYSVHGEGRRHTLQRVSVTGQFLGMVAADTSTYTISLRGVDVSMPGRQSRADTLAVIPE